MPIDSTASKDVAVAANSQDERPTLALRLTVNGRMVERTIEPQTILLDFLRDDLGLTGAKRSCDLQVCGSCTVLVDGVPVSSCCTLVYEANGKDVLTIEGLSPFGSLGELHPIQQAFVDHNAVQCGFCTAGMILSAKALIDLVGAPSHSEVQQYMRGNLCRCTGYWNIVEAVVDAGQRLRGERSTDRSGTGELL
jgi:aerobic-type carbon monoxide dehydrogenase small subunit (CoxS/CutS family)